MAQFVSHAQALFEVEEVHDYCPRVKDLHVGYMREQEGKSDGDSSENGYGYDADIHLPVLLRLRLRQPVPMSPEIAL